MMDQYKKTWGSSECLYSNQPINDVKVELKHGESQKPGPTKDLTAYQRLEKQKERVYRRTIHRLLARREALENERLQYAYRDGVDVAITQNKIQDDLNQIMKRYQVPKKTRLSQVENTKYHSEKDDSSVLKRESHFKGPDHRYGPSSAAAKKGPNLHTVLDRDERSVKSKKLRIKSAPPTNTRSKHQMELFSDDIFVLSDFPKRGCCSADGRFFSAPHSTVSLSTPPSPCFYQHFLCKKYFLYKRPRSALTMRTNELEAELRRNCYYKLQVYTNIAQPCVLHERLGERRSRPARSPRSPRLGRDRIRQAWTDKDDDYDEQFSDEIDKDQFGYDDDFSVHEGIEITLVDGADKANKEHEPTLAKYDDALGSQEDGKFFTKQPTPSLVSSRSDSLRNEGKRDVSGLSENQFGLAEDTPGFLPTLIGESKGFEGLDLAESILESEEGATSPEVDLSTVPQPPQLPTTDMLTGVVFHPGAVASEKPLPEDGAFPISVSIQIPDPLPDPLPVKRYPEPDVRSVDVVSPTEELRAYGSQLFDSNRPVSSDHFEALDENTFLDSSGKYPPSILKKSQESVKEKKVTQVKFDVATVSDSSPAENREAVTTVESAADLDDRSKKDEKMKLKEPEISDAVSRDHDAGASPEKTKVDSEKKASKTELDGGPIADAEKKPTPESQSAALITTPQPQSKQDQVPSEPSKLPKDRYEEPTDKYLQKLLAAPDLHGFVPPEFEVSSVKTKKKKRPKSGKKTKGKKKSEVIVKAESKEPLFTYIPKSAREKEEEPPLMQEENELSLLIAAVRRYEDNYKEKMKNQPWLFGRMALSKQICRFWIPVDLRQLEGISPSKYLLDYCIVCKRRQKLYSMAFERQLQKRKLLKSLSSEKKKFLSVKEAQVALRDVHGNCITESDVGKVFSLVYIDEAKEDDPSYVSRVSLKLFINVCALTERIFYNQFVTEDTEDSQKGHRDHLEAADFHGLKWKLNDVGISKGLRNFLLSL